MSGQAAAVSLLAALSTFLWKRGMSFNTWAFRFDPETAGIDLCLALVEEDHGHAVALAIARPLLMSSCGQAQSVSCCPGMPSPCGLSENFRSRCWRTCELT
jgi:hypothetical protein